MKIADTIPRIDAKTKAELQEALADLSCGVRDPTKMKAACERMDRMREENRRRFGESDIAVQVIRETRDQA